jgi:hypothetical protein
MRNALPLFVLLTIATSVRVASAGDVRIRGDRLDMDLGTQVGNLTLFGDRQFTFSSTVSPLSGVFTAGECNASLCLPGATVSLHTLWSGPDVQGTATLDGLTYPNVGGTNSPSSMAVEFFGSMVLPPATVSRRTVTAPFTFRGAFTHPVDASEQLTGSGLVFVDLSLIQSSGTWHVDRVLYWFTGSGVGLPWSTEDVGLVGTPGRGEELSRELSSTFFLDGAGADIWGTADAFGFLFRPVIDEAEIVARVVIQTSTDPFAKAGVMLRASVDPGSPGAILDVKPDGGLEFMVRLVAGEDMVFVAGGPAAVSMPWLKMVRAGGQLTAFQSADGRNWVAIGSFDAGPLPRDLFAGLAVTSHDPAVLNHGVFDGVLVTSSPPASNLLISGGFEAYVPPGFDLPAPLGWKSDDPFRQTPAKSETNQPRTGGKNGACWTPAFLDCGLYQEVVAPLTASYTFRIYATADRPGGLVGVNVNGALAISADVEPRGFDNYGSSYELRFDAVSGDTIRVWMYSPGTPGYVVVDDATLMLDQPVSITDGEWVYFGDGQGSSRTGRFTLNSGDVVRIIGVYDYGPVEPVTVCGNFLLAESWCVAGDVVGLSSAFTPPTPQTPPVPIFAGGAAIVGSTSYPGPLGFAGEIHLLGDAVTLPAPPGETVPEHVTVTAPFRLTGDLQGWVIIARDAKMLFDLPLVGHGTATLDLVASPGPNGPTMGFFRLTYSFEK